MEVTYTQKPMAHLLLNKGVIYKLVTSLTCDAWCLVMG